MPEQQSGVPVVNDDPSTDETLEESTEEAAPSESGDEPKKRGLQKRFSELTAQIKDGQARAEAAENDARELRKQLAELSSRGPMREYEEMEPDPDSYPDKAEWKKAHKEWREAGYMLRQHLVGQATQQAEMAKSFQSVLTSGRSAHDDFDAVVNNPSLPPLHKFAPAAFEELVRSEHGSEIAYQLAKNPDKLWALSGADPRTQMRLIWQMNNEIASVPARQSPTNVPPTQVRGHDGLVVKDPDKMSMKEYIAWRRRSNG